jgi:hypothetical protein
MTYIPRFNEPIDWTQCNIDAHGRAWMTARAAFVRDMEREPKDMNDFSAIARRSEIIRKEITK